MQESNYLWWQRAIIYQVYPRSFQDSNEDGIGDLLGVLQRLDYLKWLGIEAIWLSPIFTSPMADFGYDVADYEGIDPIFGNMADFDLLLAKAHELGIKVLLDLVPNHSSSNHPWFLESKSSRDNPKRDWYIWKDASTDGSEPNNWLSVFGGSGWEWDEPTQQYYYHGFLKEQPDLNWRNEEVVEAMLQVMRFWFDKGVDGFRVDVLWHIFKDEKFRDNPKNPDFLPHLPTYEQLLPTFSTDQPEVQEIVKRMRLLANEYDDKVIIGEIYLPYERLMAYYGVNQDGIHLPFNFTLIALDWNPQTISDAVAAYEKALPLDGWPNWVISNHDRPRIASRIGEYQSRVAAMLLLTLRGTPTLYYGDEIGMQDVQIPIEEIKDPQGLNMPELNLSRDPARTPMQWNNSQNAGFSNVKPWLRVAENFASQNVATLTNDPNSILSFYQKLIQLRQQESSLLYGSYELIFVNQNMLAYTRKLPGYDGFLILLNFTNQHCLFENKEAFEGKVELSSSTRLSNWQRGEIELLPNDALLIRLAKQ